MIGLQNVFASSLKKLENKQKWSYTYLKVLTEILCLGRKSDDYNTKLDEEEKSQNDYYLCLGLCLLGH